MTGLSNYSAFNLLNGVVGRSAYVSPTGVWLALFTAVGTDIGTGFTEVNGAGYARVNASGSTYWGAATGTAPASITNSAGALNFPQATVSWGTVIGWGLYDASGVSSGNLLFWDFLGNDPWFPFTSTASTGTTVFTAIGITAGSNPNLANGAPVVFTSEYGGALPNTITQYNPYTVAGLSADTFNVGVSASTTAAGMVRQITEQSIPANVTASFNSSNLTLTAA